MPDRDAGIAEDRRLVLLAKEGDRVAFGCLVEKYAGVVRSLVAARLGRGHEAEDAAQDAFLLAFERLRELDDPERFAGWLSRIAVNSALEKLRRAERRRASSLSALPAEPAAPEPHASRVEVEEEVARLLQFLSTLDDRTQLVLTLRFRQEMAVKDIAARLGENPPAVAMRISRALRKLRELMEQEGRP